MKAFLPHINNFHFLPYQVRAIRQYLPWIDSIEVVQGPFGGGRWDGKTKLTKAFAAAFDVSIRTLYDAGPGGAYGRQSRIVEKLLSHQEGLILQGDCIPTTAMTLEQLLDGHVAAGRAHMVEGRLNLQWTWIVSKSPLKEAVKDFRVWGSQVDNVELNTEFCEPGFLHLDKIAQAVRLDEKLALVIARFGEMPQPEVEEAV